MRKQLKPYVPLLDLTQIKNLKNESQLSSSNSLNSEDEELFKTPASEKLKDDNNTDILQDFCNLVNKDRKDLIELFFVEYPYILHIAAECGVKEIVKKILELKPELIDITIYNGLTVLHSAVLGVANVEIFEILLAANPKLINAKDHYNNTASYYGEIHGFGSEIFMDDPNNTKKIAEIFHKYAKDLATQQIGNGYITYQEKKVLKLLGNNNDNEAEE